MYIPQGGIEEFRYLPLFALVFSPFSMLEKMPALYLWSLLNILILYVMFTLLYRMKPLFLDVLNDVFRDT